MFKASSGPKCGLSTWCSVALLHRSGSRPIEIEDSQDAAGARTDLQRLEAGETVEVQGSGQVPYKLRKFDGGYSCTCPGWTMNVAKKGAQACSCKHLRQLRGPAEDERVRTAGAAAAKAAPAARAPKAAPAATVRSTSSGTRRAGEQ